MNCDSGNMRHPWRSRRSATDLEPNLTVPILEIYTSIHAPGSGFGIDRTNDVVESANGDAGDGVLIGRWCRARIGVVGLGSSGKGRAGRRQHNVESGLVAFSGAG